MRIHSERAKLALKVSETSVKPRYKELQNNELFAYEL